MEKFSIINFDELQIINGGDFVDVVLGVGGAIVKGTTGTVMGVIGAGKSVIDWIDDQPW